MANINLIITEILSLQSAEEINQAVREINTALKYVRGRDLRKKKYEFSIGDEVSMVNGRDGETLEGRITKIKRSNAEVNVDGITWNVPITAMNLI